MSGSTRGYSMQYSLVISTPPVPSTRHTVARVQAFASQDRKTSCSNKQPTQLFCISSPHLYKIKLAFSSSSSHSAAHTHWCAAPHELPLCACSCCASSGVFAMSTAVRPSLLARHGSAPAPSSSSATLMWALTDACESGEGHSSNQQSAHQHPGGWGPAPPAWCLRGGGPQRCSSL